MSVQRVEKLQSPAGLMLGWRLSEGNYIRLLNALVLIGTGLLWHVIAYFYASPFIPGPIEVWNAGVTLVSQGDINGNSLWLHIYESLTRVLGGFALAILTGVPLGIILGLFPTLNKAFRVILEPLRFIPPLAWIPMALVILTGFSRYAFIIWLGAVFPILIATMNGIPRIDPVNIDVARVHGASWWWTLRKVVIPSILPDILGGMRVGLGVAWMCIVAAEMIGGGMTGLGKLLLIYAEMLRMPEIVVGMIVIGITGFIMNELLLQIERRAFAYRAVVQL